MSERREIPGYPGYFVTRDGQIKGKKGWILAQQKSWNGRYHVCASWGTGLVRYSYINHDTFAAALLCLQAPVG